MQTEKYRWSGKPRPSGLDPLERAQAIVAASNHAILRTGPHATREMVIDALVAEGVSRAEDGLVDAILEFVNNR